MKVLIHTSGTEIKKIEKDYGIFEDVLFFSNNGYVHTSSDTVYTYIIKAAEDDIIEARQLDEFYATESFVTAQKELMETWCVDAETAYDLIADYVDACDISNEINYNDSCLSWDVQKLQAKVAMANGFKFVQSKDENGTVYASAMFGRESEMQLVDNDFEESDIY